MTIVIIGAGKLGMKLVELLSSENHNITIVDSNADRVERCVNSYDVLGLEGNGASYDVLIEAGVKNADIVLALTGSDEKNILCSMVARKIGTQRTIARVRNIEYYGQIGFLRKELGIDLFVNPDLEASTEIARALLFPQAIQIDSFADGRINLVELSVYEDGPLDNLQISELEHRSGVKVLVCVVEREDEAYIPKGDFTLKAGDKVYISSSHKNLGEFMGFLGAYNQKRIKTVIIIGGGRISQYTIRHLLRLNMRIKVIEKDKDRCIALDDEFDKIRVICGDGTDQDLLEEEGIDNVDAFLALTGNDEINVILSMYAQSKNISKIITKVSKLENNAIIDHIGLDTIVCPKLTVSNQILSYVHANSNASAKHIQMLYKLVGGKAEALEFHISDKDKIVGKRLSDLNMRDDVLISCISRENKIIFPTGKDEIQDNDRVLVVTTANDIYCIDDVL